MDTTNETTKRYRAASWWIVWEDLSYPDLGIEAKVQEKAARFNDAGIDLAIVFGCHFRWDFIYMWDRVHDLLQLIADELHKYDIKLFDHHSANLTCRPRNFDERWNNFYRNKHHIPFYPSKNIINDLTFNGSNLNDFRMIDVVTREACYLPQYNAEIYCMNNPEFQAAYAKYLKLLFAEADIDGLMCDDIVHYPGWHSCGCEYCQMKFKNRSGIELPPTDDTSFWGNYDSVAFKSWVEMRHNDSSDFLKMVESVLAPNIPLLSCCSDSWTKHLDASGMSICSMQRSINHGMLEMCSEIVSEDNSYTDRIANIMLHSGILNKNNFTSLGLGYGFCKDTAFLTWALNALTGSSCWMSTLKGRLGIGKEDADTLPDEEDIVAEGYIFEKNNPQLFTGKSSAKTALFFSFNTLKFSGDSCGDYSDTYKAVIDELFANNVQFDVIDSLQQTDAYTCLLLNDTKCLSDKEIIHIKNFNANGGTIIATGAIGEADETGEQRSESLLQQYGISATYTKNKRELLSAEKFFTPGEWPPERASEQLLSAKYENVNVDKNQWIKHKHTAGLFYWHGMRCQDLKSVKSLVEKLNNIQNVPLFNIDIDGEWFWRIYRDNNRYLIHILSNEITATADPLLENHRTKRKVIRGLKYHTAIDKITIGSSFKVSKASLYSPDCNNTIDGVIANDLVSFSTPKLKRYFVVELVIKNKMNNQKEYN